MKTFTKISLIALLLCGFSILKAQVPPTAPPDLPYDAEEVLSFFSEKYGEAFAMTPGTPAWGQTSTWGYTATGDEEAGLIIINNLNWLPIGLNGTARIKDYEYVHIDVYCNEDTDFRIGFHRHYPDTREQYFPMIEKGTMVPGKWYSIDYLLDDFFLAGWGGNDAHYLRIGGELELNGYVPDWSDEIYITNFVAYNGEPECLGGCVRDESSINYVKGDASLNIYIKDGSLNFGSDETINQISLYNVTGQLAATFDANAYSGSYNISNLESGVYVVSASVGNDKVITKKVVK